MRGLLRASLLILALMLATQQLMAESEFSWGPKLGFNLAQHYGTKTSEEDYAVRTIMRPGIMAGAYLDMEIVPGFSLAYELLYSQKGSNERIKVYRIDELGDGVMVPLPKPAEMKVKYYLDYVEVPILLKVRAIDKPKLSLYAITGTAMGIKVKGDRELDGTVYLANGDEFDTLHVAAKSKLDEVNMFDFSFVYGGALALKTKIPLNVEYRFTLGWDYLSLPTNPEFDSSSKPVELRNQTYSLILSTTF